MNKYTFLPIIAALVIATPAIAAESSAMMMTRTPKATPDLNCLKTAVDSRETTISSAYSTLSSAISTAYSTRKTGLDTAYGLTDGKSRRMAIRTAYKSFTTSVQSARESFRKSRVSAWTQFSKDSKVCRPSSDDTSSHDTSADSRV